MVFGTLARAFEAVVVLGAAARRFKGSFPMDRARLELDRAQVDEQRRRVDEALRLELRGQAADREIARLRLLAGASMVGWIASVMLLGWRIPLASTPVRIALALGWLLLLAALGAAFSAMGRVSAAAAADTPASADPGSSAQPMWLLILGLALTAATLLM